MDVFSRLCLCMILYPTHGIQSSGQTTIFAPVGGAVSLPCALPSIKPCSWWWKEGPLGINEPLVQSGRVTDTERGSRLTLGQDCSLQFHHLDTSDGLFYTCNGEDNPSVSLELLNITLTLTPGKIQLECFPTTSTGSSFCHNGTQMKWLSEDDTEIKGDRFRCESKVKSQEAACIAKLCITTKMTDHHRKWKCQLIDSNGVKTDISYTTAIPNGTEEVFAVVGESVSLSCDGKSSRSLRWSLGERLLVGLSQSGGVTVGPQGGPAFRMNPHDSSLVINNVKPLHSGHYNCSLHNESTVITLNKIKLHTLDVTAEEASPRSKNLTLTCLLTCEGLCETDFNLTWTYGNQDGWQSRPTVLNNTLVSSLFLPGPHSKEKAACSVSREGVRMATKNWTFQPHVTLNTTVTNETYPVVQPVPIVAWLVPLSVLLLCAVVGGGIYWFNKRRRRGDAEDASSNIVMQNHVYEDVQDLGRGDVAQPSDRPRRAVSSTNDSFYDLLQAVN